MQYRMYFVFFTILKTDCCAQELNTCVKYDGQAYEKPKDNKERQELSLLQKVEVMDKVDSGSSSPVDSCSWRPLRCN